MIDPKQFERGSDFRGDYPRQVNEELAFFVGRYLVRYLRDRVPAPRQLPPPSSSAATAGYPPQASTPPSSRASLPTAEWPCPPASPLPTPCAGPPVPAGTAPMPA